MRLLQGRILFTLLSFLLIGTVSAQPTSPDQAQQLVQTTTDQVLGRLNKERAELEANPDKIYPLVEDLVLPHFDFERMSQWVLGKHWKGATKEQRQRFTSEFRNLLVRTYAKALLEYRSQSINYLPVQAGEDAKRVVVKTEIQQPGAPAIALNYSMYLKGNAWKVYDITVEGVSLVSNYRSSFATEIRQGGMDRLISNLESMNARAAENG